MPVCSRYNPHTLKQRSTWAFCRRSRRGCCRRGFLQKALEAQPDFTEAQYHLALLYKKEQKLPQAVDLLKQVVERQPKNAEARYNLGVIYVGIKQYRPAVTEFEAAIALRPDFREAYYSLGVCYEFYISDIPKALEYYRTFLALGAVIRVCNSSSSRANGAERQGEPR